MSAKKIFISAIETSGDLHAARLVHALKKQNKDLSFVGIGSHALEKEGVDVLLDLSSRSTVGFIEPLRHIAAYLKAFSWLKKYLCENKFDMFICVDGQGFHFPSARYAKSLGIPVVYYISPQEWMWGTDEGGRKVIDICDLIISIFPEEHKFYQKLGGHSVYNGHPLGEIVKVSSESFRRKHNLSEDKPLVALFPGSRKQELDNLLPVFLKIAKLSKNKEQFVIAAASEYCYKRLKKSVKNIPIVFQENYEAMSASDMIISSTGTITLEAALIGTPIIATYKFPPASYWLVKTLFGKKIPKYKALPNMLTNREIMPERIQQGVTAPELYKLLSKTLYDTQKIQEMKKEFLELKKKLSAENVLEKNARAVLELLK